MAKRPSKTSSIWLYFDEVPDNPCVVMCKIAHCRKPKINRGKPGTAPKNLGTKSMWDHLQTHHKKEYAEACRDRDETTSKKKEKEAEDQQKRDIFVLENNRPKQVTLKQAHERGQPWGDDHPKQKELEYLMAEWLINDLLPYTAVEDECLMTFLLRLNKKFVPPSEKKFRTTIVPDIAARLRQELERHLREAFPHYSATTDIWSSKSNHSFISFTIHYINAEWNRKSCVLQCMPFDEAHSADHIAKKLAGVVDAWHIDGKIHVIVRDNALNMVNAMKINTWDDAGCFLHMINLVVNNSVMVQSGVKRMMTRANNLVTHVRKSPKVSQALAKHQKELGIVDTPENSLTIPSEDSLLLPPPAEDSTVLPPSDDSTVLPPSDDSTVLPPVDENLLNPPPPEDTLLQPPPANTLILGEPTRWGSYYNMFLRLQEQKRAIRRLEDDPDISLKQTQTLTTNDWILIPKVVELLKPLADAQIECEGENVSIADAIPQVKAIRWELSKVTESGIGTMKTEIETQLDRYFSGDDRRAHFKDLESEPIYAVATLLDPRYKLHGFSSKVKAEIAKSTLIGKVREKRPTVTQSRPRAPESGKGSKWDAILSSSDEEGDEDVGGGDVGDDYATKQVEKYIAEKRLDVEGNPLEYWRDNERKHPELGALAKQYLCAPISSVSSEREFKVASDISGGKRASTLPKNIEMLLFAKYNQRALGFNTYNLPPVKHPESEGPAAGTSGTSVVSEVSVSEPIAIDSDSD